MLVSPPRIACLPNMKKNLDPAITTWMHSSRPPKVAHPSSCLFFLSSYLSYIIFTSILSYTHIPSLVHESLNVNDLDSAKLVSTVHIDQV
jgi:hypothetical protein